MDESLTTESRDLTDCSKCHQFLKSPLSLPCLHNYCTNCLAEHIRDANQVTCLDCGEEFDIPPDGLKKWQPLAIVNRLTEQKTMQMKLMSEETLHCTACVHGSDVGGRSS